MLSPDIWTTEFRNVNKNSELTVLDKAPAADQLLKIRTVFDREIPAQRSF